MKKSFLKTFIVLGLFSIFLCGSFEIAGAQLPSQQAANPKGYNPSSVEARAVADTPVSSVGNQENWFENSIQTIMMTFLIKGSQWVSAIVAFAGRLFDYVLQYTTTYPTNLSQGIYGSWKIIRDFSNIILVFSLLYLGIRTIYEGQGFAEKKTLAGIILAAILINFSFFFVKDVAFNLSNTVGLQILQQAKTDSTNDSYSAGLMTIVKPQKVLALNGFSGEWAGSAIAKNERGDWNIILNMAGQFIMFTTIVVGLGFVFIGASMMLLYRLVIFVILMIFAPFGLISTQIPWMQKYGKDWLDHLKKQSLFFPAFTLTLYIVLYIVTALASSPAITTTLDTTNQSQMFLFLFNFILIIFFMGALLVLPGKMGMAGSELMTKSSGFLKNKIRNIPKRSGQIALGGAARTGRTFVGGGIGGGLVDGNSKFSKSLKNIAADPNSKWGGVARATLRRGEALKNSTFDVRNTKAGAKLGMGKGIESWGALVDSKKKKLEDRKKKEEKLFGFDKLSKDNKKAVATAEAERDFQADKVNKEQEKVKKAQEQFQNKKITEAERDRAIANHQKEQEQLEKLELEVGKAKNLGDSKYLELMKKRTERRYKLGFNVAEKEAYGKVKKDLEKKWKEEGKAKQQKKKDKGKDTTTPSTPPKTSGSPTNYITLPPNLPLPTGL